MQKACKRNVCRLLIGGAAGIRTLVPVKANGFQDRLVMTTSIQLRVPLVFTERQSVYKNQSGISTKN